MEDRRLKIPSIRGLEAFTAVGQTGSMRAAAKSLHLTVSAVSHRIGLLEAELNRRLFDRSEQGLKLTEAGRDYLELIEPHLQSLEKASAPFPPSRRRLVIASAPVFYSDWLTARLGRFLADRPGIEIDLVSLDSHSASTADIQIFPWFSAEPPSKADLLFQWQVTPICRPDLMSSDRLLDPRDLANTTLIDLKSRLASWRAWFSAAGISENIQSNLRWLILDSSSLMIDSAQKGLGVAISATCFTEHYLSHGLVHPFNVVQKMDGGMYINVKSRGDDCIADDFRTWVFVEAEQTLKNIDKRLNVSG